MNRKRYYAEARKLALSGEKPGQPVPMTFKLASGQEIHGEFLLRVKSRRPPKYRKGRWSSTWQRRVSFSGKSRGAYTVQWSIPDAYLSAGPVLIQPEAIQAVNVE